MGKAWGAVAPLPPRSSATRPGILLGSRSAARRRIGPFPFPFRALSAPDHLRGGREGLRAHPVLRSSSRMKKRGIRMEDIKKDGAKSFDVRMSGCQDVRMSGCQDVRMPECQNVRMSGCQSVRMSECQDAGHDGSEERRGGRASGCRRGGARDGGASQSFSRGRRSAFPQHSMPRRGARVKGGLGDDGKKVVFAMSS